MAYLAKGKMNKMRKSVQKKDKKGM